MKFHRIEVRCCCDPQRLYETLPVRDDHLRKGAVLSYPIGPKQWPAGLAVVPEDLGALSFEVERFSERGHSDLALRYERTGTFEQKLELVRRLPGFEVAEHIAQQERCEQEMRARRDRNPRHLPEYAR